jgi:hypothetical protein
MNKEKIISVINGKQGLSYGRLVNVYGEMCFIGALLHNAGYSRTRLNGLSNCLLCSPFDRKKLPTSRTKEYWARKKLKDVYEMTDDDINDAIRKNDSLVWVTDNTRKLKMIRWVQYRRKQSS